MSVRFLYSARVAVTERFVALNMSALVFVSIKQCPGHFSDSLLNTDTRIIRTRVPLVSVLIGFQCNTNTIYKLDS